MMGAAKKMGPAAIRSPISNDHFWWSPQVCPFLRGHVGEVAWRCLSVELAPAGQEKPLRGLATSWGCENQQANLPARLIRNLGQAQPVYFVVN